MSKPLRKPNGQFNGSIGSGVKGMPTAPPLTPAASVSAPDVPVLLPTSPLDSDDDYDDDDEGDSPACVHCGDDAVGGTAYGDSVCGNCAVDYYACGGCDELYDEIDMRHLSTSRNPELAMHRWCATCLPADAHAVAEQVESAPLDGTFDVGLLTAAARHPNEVVQAAAVTHPRATADTLSAWFASEHRHPHAYSLMHQAVRRAVCPATILVAAAHTYPADVARHPNTPLPVLEPLAVNANREVRLAATEHPRYADLPEAVLTEAALMNL